MITNPETHLAAIQTIPGPRVVLRRFRDSDAQAIVDYGSDPETLRYLVWPGAFTTDAALDAIQGYFAQNPGSFAITIGDKCIGSVDLWIDVPNEKGVFGYVLHRDYWNRGYMSETLALILQTAFETLELNRVEATHYAGNPASGRVMEKCGLRREGLGRREVKVKGIFHDVMHYALLREDWLAAKNPDTKA